MVLVVGQFDVFGLVTTGSNAQTDPLPWYLVTNLPAPNAPERDATHPATDLAEVVRLYGLRNWVEQR